MNSVSKVQFGQLNDKRFYFCDGISIPYSHPLLEIWERKNLNIETFIVLLNKKEKLSECEVVKKIPQLDIIRQIHNQIPLSYELNSGTNFISFGWKPTKEYIKSGGWKCLQFMMVNFMETY